MMSGGDVARRAAEIVQERGHCKGDIRAKDGRVCMWGALLDAFSERDTSPGFRFYPMGLSEDIYNELANQLRAMGYDDNTYYPGAGFNDEPETTEQDVAKTLLQLADRLDFGGAS